jgi:hypothetical protein
MSIGNFLELFSGTATVSKEAEKRGYTVRNVELLPKFKPTYCSDIRVWDYAKDLEHFIPDIIWCSYPCCEFSNIKNMNSRPRNLEKGRELMLKGIEIIEWCLERNPELIYIYENPVGLARHQPEMKDIPFRNTVTYCHYGEDYKKPTDLFSNKKFDLKYCKGDCGKLIGNTKSHKGRICFGGKIYDSTKPSVKLRKDQNTTSTTKVGSIPTSLISAILEQITGDTDADRQNIIR